MKRETLGERLAQLRREKAANDRRDIDQADVAKAIGLPGKQSYVSRWEADVIPRDEILKKLADYYEVTIGWLRYGEGQKRLDPLYGVKILGREPEGPEAAAARPVSTKPAPRKRQTGGGR